MIQDSRFNLPAGEAGNNSKRGQGFSLVEVLIGAAIIMTTVVTLVGVYSSYIAKSSANTETLQASFLLEEGLEALRIMRDEDWTAYISPVTLGTDYYLTWNGTSWRTTTTPNSVGVFTRSFVLEEAYRDGDDRLAASGTADPNTRKVTITATWQGRSGTMTKSLVSYIHNIAN